MSSIGVTFGIRQVPDVGNDTTATAEFGEHDEGLT
jgi:hypothetical protein